MARVIVIESALSFLGLGVQPPTPTWGGMLADGRVYLSTAWWRATSPGLAILVRVLGINLFGDGLRDTLDPQGVAARPVRLSTQSDRGALSTRGRR
jgi:peptide/nickel transport system permease protein